MVPVLFRMVYPSLACGQHLGKGNSRTGESHSLESMSSEGNIAERVKVATSNGGDPPPSLWAMLSEGNIAERVTVAYGHN